MVSNIIERNQNQTQRGYRRERHYFIKDTSKGGERFLDRRIRFVAPPPIIPLFPQFACINTCSHTPRKSEYQGIMKCTECSSITVILSQHPVLVVCFNYFKVLCCCANLFFEWYLFQDTLVASSRIHDSHN